MGLFDSLFGRQRVDPDDIAIAFTQAMLSGDIDRVHQLTDPNQSEVSQALLNRFLEADLARWFGRLKSLAAPAHSIEAATPAELRYVVGRISLPDSAVQDFPIMTVAMSASGGQWLVVNARANSALFDEPTEPAADDAFDSLV